MGKFIETKYSNVQRRVIKRATKSIKKLQKDLCQKEELKGYSFQKIKRKIGKLPATFEPPAKKPKIQPVENTRAVGFQNLKVVATTNSSNRYVHLKSEEDIDLFCDDELKASYTQYTSCNFLFHVIDEICLEGLDGITVEAFRKRLRIALKHPTSLDIIEPVIWKIICSSAKIKFYLLPSPRKELTLHSRCIDLEIGVVMDKVMPDIYEHANVKGKEKDASDSGSCPTYKSRVDVTDEIRDMSLERAFAEYKNHLVIVADQELRTNALINDKVDPNIEIPPTEYCILERIGRSRSLGQPTQGVNALSNLLSLSSKSVFHYRKNLLKQNLVSKQFFMIKCPVRDQNKIGSLLHLRRFYQKKKSKNLLIAEAIINSLKKSPTHSLEFMKLRAMLNAGRTLKRVLKFPELQKYVNIHTVPYREVYPNARKAEWKLKSKNQEKQLRLIELKDPYVNISACWSDLAGNVESSDEEDDNDEASDLGSRALNIEAFRDVYLFILSKGLDGCYANEIKSHFSLDKFNIRGITRKLVAQKAIETRLVDIGRTRLNLYIASRHLQKTEVLPPIPDVKIEALQRAGPSILERQKNVLKRALNGAEPDRIYGKRHYQEDKAKNYLKLEFLPNIPDRPSVICEYIVSDYRPLGESASESTPGVNLTSFTNTIEVRLLFVEFDLDELDCIADMWAKFNDNPRETLKINYPLGECCFMKRKIDLTTKVYLLRALFGEIVIHSDEVLSTLNPSWSRGKMLSEEDDKAAKIETNTKAPRSLEEKLNYMVKPVQVAHEVVDDIDVEILMSAPPKTYVTGDITQYKHADKKVTDRVLQRISIMLDMVNSTGIFEDMYKMAKVIRTREIESGYDKKIDRKSLARLYRKLVIEGYIKIYKVTIKSKSLVKTQSFVCHPSVSHTHSYIRSIIDQLKFRYFLKDDKKQPVDTVLKEKPSPVDSKRSPFIEDDVLESISEIRKLNQMKIDSIKSKYMRSAGKSYGCRSKFVKMNIVHELLFYLIYELPKDTKRLDDAQVLELFERFQINLTGEDLATLPPIYCNEISWKMFIPPLPRHQGWEDGWALLCDVVLRIPLSVLVKIHNVTFLMPEITDTLQHPIKRYYLMRYQPEAVTSAVMYQRKYIFDIYEIVCRLAYCGLVQFGPSRYKEKDQMFMYLNRRASLLDTSTSEPGYHKVTDKEYRKLAFYFNSLNDLDQYWSSMYEISMNTQLNSRNVMKGKTITLVDVTAKPDLMRALSAKTPEEVLKYDDGHIPGDRRGAAGIDSSMWTHIAKNWFWMSGKEIKKSVSCLKTEKLQQVLPRVVSFQELYETVMPTKVYLPKPLTSTKTKPKLVKTKWQQRAVKQRHINWNRKPKKVYYDSVDRAILKKITGSRLKVTWSEAEDRALFFIKLASMLIGGRRTKQVVFYNVVRDVLHRMVPSHSKDKTARVCQRRLKLLFKDGIASTKMEANLLNLLKLEPVAKYFTPFVKGTIDASGRPIRFSDDACQTAFIFLMSYIAGHQREVAAIMQMHDVDHLCPENLEFCQRNLVQDYSGKFKDAADEDSICLNVVKSVIVSSLSNKSEQAGSALQLFNIYQKYNDVTIKSALHELKESQIVSHNKSYSFKHTIPYQLSSSYVLSQSTTFNYRDAEEAFEVFGKLRERKLRDAEHSNGKVLGVIELGSFMWPRVVAKIDLPHYSVILNPDIEDHSEVIEELAKRYLNKLNSDNERRDLEKNSTKIQMKVETNTQEADEASAELDDELGDMDIPLDHEFATISGLKSWIHDCIDSNRVRSPSPELLNFKEASVNTPKIEKKDKPKTIEPEQREVNPTEGKIWTLEEIKEEMLKENPEVEKRSVPYVLDLTDLLEADPEDLDEAKRMDQLKSHFVPQFPELEEFAIDDSEFVECPLLDNLEDLMNGQKMWDEVERAQIIGTPRTIDDAVSIILLNRGVPKDIEIMNAVIELTLSRGMLGVSAVELKATFTQQEGNCPLEFIVKTLIDFNILLRAGVCSIYLVHHSFESSWLVESFVLSNDERRQLQEVDAYSEKTKEVIRTKMESQSLRLRLFPWTKFDGTYNKSLFKLWIGNILSHCVENPQVTMTCLCDKFNMFKPVDVFFLLEILQELHCVEICRVEKFKVDAFSFWHLQEECKGTFLDDFDEIFVRPSTVAFVLLGSFLGNNAD